MSSSRWQQLLMLMLTLGLRDCLDNGLALTPPRGWVSTERYDCNTDCINYPDDCVSEKLVRKTTDAILSRGFRDAGYNYVILGDCWMNQTRDHQGNIQPDVHRFPGGMASLVKYVHSKGLLLGLKIDLSNASCHGYPGSYGNYRRDAGTIATWGVDYVIASACGFHQSSQLHTAYKAMGEALNQTGRAMVYDCNWPLESLNIGKQPDYGDVSRTCNVYRTHKAMVDSWESLEDTVKYYVQTSRQLANYSRPGSWNLPNLILVGDYGLSISEQYMQMAVWSLMNAPLLVSADLGHVTKTQGRLLVDKSLLALDADITDQIGMEVVLKGQVHIWRKAVQPAGSYALVIMYFNVSGGPSRVSVILRDIGVVGAEWYRLTDVTSGKVLGMYQAWYTLDYRVPPVSAVYIHAQAVNSP